MKGEITLRSRLNKFFCLGLCISFFVSISAEAKVLALDEILQEKPVIEISENTSIEEITEQVDRLQLQRNTLATFHEDAKDTYVELDNEIQRLQDKIENQADFLSEQARNLQVNLSSDNLLDELLNSESVTEAFKKIFSLNIFSNYNQKSLVTFEEDKAMLKEIKAQAANPLQALTNRQADIQQIEAKIENLENKIRIIEEAEAEVERNRWHLPVENIRISSPFGYRRNPFGYGGEFHRGIDFIDQANTPIFAARQGVVVEAGFNASAGNHVIIQHEENLFSYYMHLSSIAVTNEQTVNPEETIGWMGTTGSSTGVHLHFAISTDLWTNFVDPAPFLELPGEQA